MLILLLTVLAGGVLFILLLAVLTTLTFNPLSLQTITSSASASGLANTNNSNHAEIILTQRVLMPDTSKKQLHNLQLCVHASSGPITDP